MACNNRHVRRVGRQIKLSTSTYTEKLDRELVDPTRFYELRYELIGDPGDSCAGASTWDWATSSVTASAVPN